MRIVFVCLFLVGCTQHNPNSCCSTTTQCADFGLDNITGCMSGKTCDSTGTCVAAQCTTSTDCTSADAPICANQMCVATCTTDDECVGISGRPLCATDGVCVACIIDSQCTTTDAPVCDTTTRSCRGCAEDGECPGGICLESEGTCKADADVFFVATVGVDSGECTRTAPCATIPYVLAKAQPQNKTIHLLGGAYNVGATTLQIGSACYIDATNTIVTSSANGPVLDYTFSLGGAVLNNVTVVGSNQTSTNVAITAEINNGTLKVYNSTIKRGLKMTGGTVSISKSTFTNPTIAVSSVDCTSGTVSIDTSLITNARVTTMNCNVTLERNRFNVNDDQCFVVTGGKALIENNVLTAQSETNDCGSIQGVTSGSTVRFNTFASLSDLVADGTALYCDTTPDVTSNIFAWGSTSPHGASACAPTYSLYDDANTVPITATSFSAAVSTFFVNKGGMDFHLSAASPAIGKAELGLDDSTDFDGNPRPSPSGSTADVGAYEAQ